MDEKLGELQAAIMRELWKREPATVAELHAAIGSTRGVAYTTISTVLRRMVKRGIVSHDVDGRTHVYSAVLREEEAGKSAVSSSVRGVFGGKASQLVSYLLESDDVDPDELLEIKQLIRQQGRRKAQSRPTKIRVLETCQLPNR